MLARWRGTIRRVLDFLAGWLDLSISASLGHGLVCRRRAAGGLRPADPSAAGRSAVAWMDTGRGSSGAIADAASESLFLLGCVAACVHFLRAEFAAALLAGILVGLPRPNGALLSLALALLWLQVEVWPRLTLWRRHAVRLGLGATAVLGPAFGVALYSSFVHGLTGDALAWASAQDGWGRLVQNPVSALASVGMRVLASPIEMATQFPADFLNGLFGMAALALAYPIGRRLGSGFGAFVASGVVLPLTVGGLASLGRYTSVLFPLFVYLAVAIPPSLRPWAAGSLMALQLVVAALFFTWRPIY